MDISLEELIRNCAINIVDGDENYHKPSFKSEHEKLNIIVKTLLHNEVRKLEMERS